MGREAELIKEIDEHIKKAEGLYGLEFPDSDLQVIRAALCRTVEADPVNKDIGFGDTVLSCPACGKPIMNYYAPGTRPDCCQFCGQALRNKGGDPPSEK